MRDMVERGWLAMVVGLLVASLQSPLQGVGDRPTAPRVPDVKQAEQAHDAAVAEAELAFRRAVLRAKQEYLARVEEALKAAFRAENLEEANRLDAIRKRLQKEMQAIQAGEELKATTPLPGIIAVSGFNEKRGLSTGDPKGTLFKVGQPVTVGGEAEPGWSGPWGVTTSDGPGAKDLVTIAASAAKEGDGGARVNRASHARNTQLRRKLAKPLEGKVRIDQWIRGDDEKAAMNARPLGPGGFGVNWGVNKGHFNVLDGKGDGTNDASVWRDAFAFKPGVWYRVTVVIDVPGKSWEFHVDGRKFQTDRPLGFRESPRWIDTVDYLYSSPFDLDAVEVTQLPR